MPPPCRVSRRNLATSACARHMTPVGNGLEFLGIAGVLMSLIIVWLYSCANEPHRQIRGYILFALLVITAVWWLPTVSHSHRRSGNGNRSTAPAASAQVLTHQPSREGWRGGSTGDYILAQEESTGILPQLLNPMREEEVETLREATEYLMQEKLDGCRLLLPTASEQD